MRAVLRFRPGLTLIIALFAVLAMPAVAAATVNTITVDSDADPGDGICLTNADVCTLHEAIVLMDDTDTTDQDQINITLTNPIDTVIGLTTGIPVIDEPLAIARSGGFHPFISGSDAFQPLRFIGPAGTDLSISGVTVSHGKPPNSFAGGGIFGGASDLTITDSTFTDNHVTDSTGGAISTGGTLTIENSTITGNSATGAISDGGGVHATGQLTIRRSTILSNTAAGQGGGGVFASGPGLKTIESSTLSGNSTSDTSAPGGGLHVSNGGATIRNSTIAGNFTSGPTSDGGGVYAVGSTPEPTLTNTIVADNTATGTGPDLESPNDTFGLAFTLVENTSSSPFTEVVPGSSIFGVDPELATLAQNGGPTPTHLPAQTSPVLDKGSTDAGVADQRAALRPIDIPHLANSTAPGGDGGDIGAVELTLAEGPLAPATAQPGAAGPTGLRAAALKKCKKKKKGRARIKCRKKAKKLPL